MGIAIPFAEYSSLNLIVVDVDFSKSGRDYRGYGFLRPDYYQFITDVL